MSSPDPRHAICANLRSAATRLLAAADAWDLHEADLVTISALSDLSLAARAIEAARAEMGRAIRTNIKARRGGGR